MHAGAPSAAESEHAGRLIPYPTCPPSPDGSGPARSVRQMCVAPELVAIWEAEMKFSEEQQRLMGELRAALLAEGLLHEFLDHKTGMFRWLQARKWSVPDAVTMVRNHLEWRKLWRLDEWIPTANGPVPRLLHEYVFPEIDSVKRGYKFSHHKTTTDGMPVYFDRLGCIDFKGMISVRANGEPEEGGEGRRREGKAGGKGKAGKGGGRGGEGGCAGGRLRGRESRGGGLHARGARGAHTHTRHARNWTHPPRFLTPRPFGWLPSFPSSSSPAPCPLQESSPERVLEYFVWYSEASQQWRFPAASLQAGRYFGKGLYVMDMKGFGMGVLNKDTRAFLAASIKVASDNYPETIKMTWIVNAPFVFRAAWAMVCKMLDDNTVRKFSILGGRSEYMPKLLSLMDKRDIPDFLGGEDTTCQFNVEVGPGVKHFPTTRGPWLREQDRPAS